jgi:hypothetical protein
VEGFREVSISSIRPRRRRWGVAHIGGGRAPPAKGALGGRPRRGADFLRNGFGKYVGALRWVVCLIGPEQRNPEATPRLLYTSKKVTTSAPRIWQAPKKARWREPQKLSRQKARCAAFHRCMSAASPRDAARLRGGVARAPRVGFGPFRSRKPARACLCAASAVPGCRGSA